MKKESTKESTKGIYPKTPAPVINGRNRVVIENVSPIVNGGKFPVKRVCGDRVRVDASAFADGHELISGRLLFRKRRARAWEEQPLEKLLNDRWTASFLVEEEGEYEYTVEAWLDPFFTWIEDLKKRVQAGQELDVELRIGAAIVSETAAKVKGNDGRILKRSAAILSGSFEGSQILIESRIDAALEPDLAALMQKHALKKHATMYSPSLPLVVERERAVFSSWYEMFPRSAASRPGQHGTFDDVIARLPYIEEMGFNILYLPPIHPIGRQFRKGKNNSVVAEVGDLGCPWAIGGPEGGHKAIHPELGTMQDFGELVSAAAKRGIEIALDIAFQCSPDHPYVRENPQWFLKRPDGSIQYAENPPKKYQDIYPFHFECEDWQSLWRELCSIFLFWADKGVKVFRVDNPHTKPFAFWQWCIAEVKSRHPETIFLSEAFTRPAPMYQLAKLGFTQSYTYFAWKNSKRDLTKWWTETVLDEPREYYRPNLWPNTPDILNEYLQHGGRPAFISRFVLAATMGASYGIYGPVYELIEHVPREPGSEEYLNSEKYQLRNWNLDKEGSLRSIISLVNRIRRGHKSLQTNAFFKFHKTDNDQIICYSKRDEERSDHIVTVVNLDPYNVQSGWLELDLEELNLEPGSPFEAHDLLTDAEYIWNGSRNFVSLDPKVLPAHILHVRRHLRSERDFDYFG